MPKQRVLPYNLDPNQKGDHFLFNLLISLVALPVNFVASLPGALRDLVRGRLHSRVPATLLIAVGGFVASAGDSLNRFGITGPFAVAKLLAVVLLLAGFLVSIEAFREIRIPFTDVRLARVRASPSKGPPDGRRRLVDRARLAFPAMPNARAPGSARPSSCSPRPCSGRSASPRDSPTTMGMEPFAFVAWRAGVGALGLWLVIAVVRRRGGSSPTAGLDRSGRAGSSSPSCSAAALNLAAFLSFENTSVALALLGFYTYPAMVAAGSVLLGRERLDAARVVALLLALGGHGRGRPRRPGRRAGRSGDLLGIALALAAAVFQTAFVLTSRGYANVPGGPGDGRDPRRELAARGHRSRSWCSAPAPSRCRSGRRRSSRCSSSSGCSRRRCRPSCSSPGSAGSAASGPGSSMLFEPVVGVALAAVILAEGLQPLQALGGATILLAALIVQRGTAARPEAPAVAPAPGGP